MRIYQSILVERDCPVTTVSIDRPAAINAPHRPAHHELGDVFNRYRSDSDLWIACLTGVGSDSFLRRLDRDNPRLRAACLGGNQAYGPADEPLRNELAPT